MSMTDQVLSLRMLTNFIPFSSLFVLRSLPTGLVYYAEDIIERKRYFDALMYTQSFNSFTLYTKINFTDLDMR